MRDDANDLLAMVDTTLGGSQAESTAPVASSSAPADQTALRELMDWVSQEVFGPAA